MYNNNKLQWLMTISKQGNLRLPSIIRKSKSLDSHDNVIIELSEDQTFLKVYLYKVPKTPSKKANFDESRGVNIEA